MFAKTSLVLQWLVRDSKKISFSVLSVFFGHCVLLFLQTASIHQTFQVCLYLHLDVCSTQFITIHRVSLFILQVVCGFSLWVCKQSHYKLFFCSVYRCVELRFAPRGKPLRDNQAPSSCFFILRFSM